jgi:hypothetical protein
MRRLLSLMVVMLAAAGCTAHTEDAPAPPSVWGDVVTVGTAPQTDAPGMVALPQRVTLAWVGATGAGVHHDVAAVLADQVTPVVTLPLPPRAPRSSRLFPLGNSNNHHLLWLDLDENGTPQLYSALIDETLSVFRGPVRVSEASARCYDAFTQANGSLRVVWLTSDPADPDLHDVEIDNTGRVLRRVLMNAVGGGCPVAVPTLDERYLLWGTANNLHLTRYTSGYLTDEMTVSRTPTLFDGDRLRSLRGGSDGAVVYAFWNITRAGGADETWYTAGQPTDPDWPAPIRLTALADDAEPFETTFNTGRTAAASEGLSGPGLAWAAPLRGVTEVLPVAVEINGSALGVVYLRGGAVVGVQQVIATRPLLGVPELQTDRDRHLYLAWAAPSDVGGAQIRLAATRPLRRESNGLLR